MKAEVKGWCPSAYRPMMSGDGLVVRVRPWLGHLSREQCIALSKLGEKYGNGVIDLTSRCNLQLRGVSADRHSELLNELVSSGVVSSSEATDIAPAVNVTPHWVKGDLAHQLAEELHSRFCESPELPGKFGIAIDTAPLAFLTSVSADIRLFKGDDQRVVVLADGARKGRSAVVRQAIDAVIELAEWFVETGGLEAGRMSRHLKNVSLPEDWCADESETFSGGACFPGAAIGGYIVGIPFGKLEAGELERVAKHSGASGLRVLPKRMLFLEDATNAPEWLICNPGNPLLIANACPGSPSCAQSSVETRALAKRLAKFQLGTLHVSGCDKGCARRSAADITLIGNNGFFDLVKNGRASDTPVKHGLAPEEVVKELSGA